LAVLLEHQEHQQPVAGPAHPPPLPPSVREAVDWVEQHMAEDMDVRKVGVLLGTGSLEVVSQPSVQQELLQTLVLVRSVVQVLPPLLPPETLSRLACLLLCRTPWSPVLMLRISQLGQHIARSLVLSQQQLSLVVDELTAHVAEQLDLVDTVQAQAAQQLADWLATQPFSRASEQTVQAQCVLMGSSYRGCWRSARWSRRCCRGSRRCRCCWSDTCRGVCAPRPSGVSCSTHC
jgi:hypothetical protein